MTETIDLRVNRLLIDARFESYYLTNQETSLVSLDLGSPVYELTLDDKQLYSYLHYHGFSKDHNYLFTDPFVDQPIGYFIDGKFDLFQVRIDQDDHSISLPRCLLSVPVIGFHLPNDCLISLSFPSKEIALILVSSCSKGRPLESKSTLLVVATGNRVPQTNKWTVVCSLDLTDETTFGSCWTNDQNQAKALSFPVKLIDSYLHSKGNKNLLEVVFLTLDKSSEERFECILNCLQLCCGQGSNEKTEPIQWTVNRLQQLTGSSYPAYVGLDTNSESEFFLTIVSASQFRSTFDLSNEPEVSPASTAQSDLPKEPLYSYSQNETELAVDFKLNKDEKHIQVDFKSNEMTIYIRGERVFKETFWGLVDPEVCTWTLDRKGKDFEQDGISVLQITLTKKEENQVWPQLIKGKEQGIEVMSSEDSLAFQDIPLLTSGLLNLNRQGQTGPGYIQSLSDNEACDEVSDDLTLYRFNCNQNSITHQAILTGHQWLFHRKINGTSLPCFSLRHDIDSLIWQPQAQGSRFSVDHIATFPALGYVQASKESKKFLNCSPDFNFAFIADATNHIYIYKQPSLCEGVVNRKAGFRAKIAKQKVINLGNEPVVVLGSAAFSGCLMILSSRKIFSIKVDF